MIEDEAYLSVKGEDELNVPKPNRRGSYRRLVRWSTIFKDCLESSYSSRGPLSCSLREDPISLNEADDPLFPSWYHGASRSLIYELEDYLPHDGPSCKNDNTSVFVKIEEAARSKYVGSTIKSFYRCKDGRSDFSTLSDRCTGKAKSRSISKKILKFLQKSNKMARLSPLRDMRLIIRNLMIAWWITLHVPNALHLCLISVSST